MRSRNRREENNHGYQSNQPAVGCRCGVWSYALSRRRLHTFPKSGIFADLEEIASYNYVNPVNPVRRPSPQAADPTRVPLAPATGTAKSTNAPDAAEYARLPGMQSMAPAPGAAGGNAAINPLAPITSTTQPPPISGDSLQYLNGFMRTQIGRTVVVEFLIRANTLVDRTGILLAVGANYILLNEIETDDILACDFFNIKFIRFYY